MRMDASTTPAATLPDRRAGQRAKSALRTSAFTSLFPDRERYDMLGK